MGASQGGSVDVQGLEVVLRDTLPRLPPNAAPIIWQVIEELRSACKNKPDGDEQAQETFDRSETSSTREGTPLGIGGWPLPLSVLLNIAGALEPNDLTPAAQACRSLCV